MEKTKPISVRRISRGEKLPINNVVQYKKKPNYMVMRTKFFLWKSIYKITHTLFYLHDTSLKKMVACYFGNPNPAVYVNDTENSSVELKSAPRPDINMGNAKIMSEEEVVEYLKELKHEPYNVDYDVDLKVIDM
jgi:hypothetical protein